MWREGYYPKDVHFPYNHCVKKIQEMSNEQLGKVEECEKKFGITI